jgi:hypothetical protein
MSPQLVKVNSSEALAFANRHADLRERIFEGLARVSHTANLQTLLLEGPRGTPVSVVKEMLADCLKSGISLLHPLKPSMGVWTTSMSEHIAHIIAYPMDPSSTLIDQIREVKRKKAVLVVTEIEALADTTVSESVRQRLAEQLLISNDEFKDVPVVAIFEKDWARSPGAKDIPVISRCRGFLSLPIGPYVAARTGELAMRYGLQGWIDKHAKFSTDPDRPLHPMDPRRKIAAEQLQQIYSDLVALEDGAYLARTVVQRVSLPYLAVWLTDSIVTASSSPERIRDRIIDAEQRIADVISRGAPSHPLYSSVITARTYIEQLAQEVRNWNVDFTDRLITPTGSLRVQIPISRCLVTAWLFGSNDAAFDWPPAYMVRSNTHEFTPGTPDTIIPASGAGGGRTEPRVTHGPVPVDPIPPDPIPQAPRGRRQKHGHTVRDDGDDMAPAEDTSVHPSLPPKRQQP